MDSEKALEQLNGKAKDRVESIRNKVVTFRVKEDDLEDIAKIIVGLGMDERDINITNVIRRALQFYAEYGFPKP